MALNDQPDLRDELIGIVNDATSARGQRGDVIHGHRHLGRKKRQLSTARTVINRRPDVKAKLKNMPPDQVEDVPPRFRK